MVPNGWSDSRVKDVVKALDAGVSVNSEDDKDLSSEFKILKTSCVSKGTFNYREVKSVKETVEIERLKEPVLSNSIIISRMNTPLLVGANAYIGSAPENTFLPDRLWQVKPKGSKVDMCWLGYWFGSSHTRYTLSSNATGTSGSMKNITKPDVMLMRLPLPPLPEQRKIAKILSTWDKAIVITEKLIDASKQQKKALMQQLLTGKKRFAGFEGEWEEVKISSLIKESRDTGTNGEIAKKLTVKLYGLGVVAKEEKRLGSTSTKYYKRKAGQFIYSKLDFLNGAFGIIPASLDGYESTLDLPAFDFTDQIVPKWFIEFVSRDDFYTSNLGLANGGRKARRVNPKDLLQIKISLPPLEEQQKTASVLTAADKEIELLETKLAHLKREKKALMQQLLTGKRRVKVEEREAA